MKIKDIKEKYKNYCVSSGERNAFIVYDWKDGNGKVLIVVNINKSKYIGDYVTQAIRISDGMELIKGNACRPCDNLNDAIDVASEMIERL